MGTDEYIYSVRERSLNHNNSLLFNKCQHDLLLLLYIYLCEITPALYALGNRWSGQGS